MTERLLEPLEIKSSIINFNFSALPMKTGAGLKDFVLLFEPIASATKAATKKFCHSCRSRGKPLFILT